MIKAEIGERRKAINELQEKIASLERRDDFS